MPNCTWVEYMHGRSCSMLYMLQLPLNSVCLFCVVHVVRRMSCCSVMPTRYPPLVFPVCGAPWFCEKYVSLKGGVDLRLLSISWGRRYCISFAFTSQTPLLTKFDIRVIETANSSPCFPQARTFLDAVSACAVQISLFMSTW